MINLNISFNSARYARFNLRNQIEKIFDRLNNGQLSGVIQNTSDETIGTWTLFQSGNDIVEVSPIERTENDKVESIVLATRS